jgi:hypothetical protein
MKIHRSNSFNGTNPSRPQASARRNSTGSPPNTFLMSISSMPQEIRDLIGEQVILLNKEEDANLRNNPKQFLKDHGQKKYNEVKDPVLPKIDQEINALVKEFLASNDYSKAMELDREISNRMRSQYHITHGRTPPLALVRLPISDKYDAHLKKLSDESWKETKILSANITQMLDARKAQRGANPQ